MSTRELAYSILESFTDEQLAGFVLLFKDIVSDIPNTETRAVLDDVMNGRNMSGTFTSVKELMEDLNAEDAPNAETEAAMLEADRIARDPNVKAYTNIDELMRDLLS